jgi:predicted Fe-S protein YdhL (DUF1289 family)
MDPRTDLCQGCGRTLTEIAQWGSMTPEQREAVMAGLIRRMSDAAMEIPSALERRIPAC